MPVMWSVYGRKVKVTHAVGLIVCLLLLYWLFLSGYRLHPSRQWKPRAGFILKPEKSQDEQSYLIGEKIPKIIHQTWKDHQIPQLMEPWVKSCVALHPDWEYWFWTDEDMLSFVSSHFPAYLDLYQSYPASGYRADVFRYLVLYEYGGVYLDLDVECVKPMDDIVQNYQCVLSQEPLEHAHFLSPMHIPLVSNAIMACHRGHNFFGQVISDLHSYTGWLKWNDILRSTGPYMLTEIYRGHIRGGTFSMGPSPANALYLATPEEFQPTTDESMRDHMRDACIHSEGHTFLSKKYLERQKQLCDNILRNGFRSEPVLESFTNHHWTHTWAGRRNDPWGIHNNRDSFDVTSLKLRR